MNYTKSQQAAIDSTSRINVIIAGPGGGKTHTLVGRIAADFRRGQAASYTAVITFTHAAAIEISKRLESTGVAKPAYVGTLHGWCLMQLGSRRVTVLAEAVAEEIIGGVIAEHHIGTTTEKVRAAITGKASDVKTKLAVKLYRQTLRRLNAVDYDLILLEALEALEAGEPCGTKHLYVDEFQDSSDLDMRIYDAIGPTTMTVVGDLDQSIYGFRGSRPENLRNIARRANTALHTLEENFRSVPAICDAANRVIRHNADRLPKRLVPTRIAGPPGAITFLQYGGSGTERLALVDSVKETLQAGRNPNDIAILVRYNADRKDILSDLKEAGLSVAAGEAPPRDWKLAEAVLSLIATPGNPMAVIAWQMALGASWKKAAEIQQALAMLGPRSIPRNMTWQERYSALREAGVSESTLRRIHKLETFTPATTLAAMRERDSNTKAPTGVTVSTYHGAKGLEWPVVFLPACEDRMVGKKDVEEARRLFFVAITRARDALHISAADTRPTTWGACRPEPTGGRCRFIDEMEIANM